MGYVLKKRGGKSKSHWNLFVRLLKIFAFLLRITGQYKKGYGNAKTIHNTEIELKVLWSMLSRVRKVQR